jgi:hypothetical protein
MAKKSSRQNNGRGGHRPNAGRKPIDPQTVTRIKRGLKQRLTQEALAGQYQISLRSVANIAAGVHPSDLAKAGKPRNGNGTPPRTAPHASEDRRSADVARRWLRCNACGHVVWNDGPCRICTARQARDRGAPERQAVTRLKIAMRHAIRLCKMGDDGESIRQLLERTPRLAEDLEKFADDFQRLSPLKVVDFCGRHSSCLAAAIKFCFLIAEGISRGRLPTTVNQLGGTPAIEDRYYHEILRGLDDELANVQWYRGQYPQGAAPNVDKLRSDAARSAAARHCRFASFDEAALALDVAVVDALGLMRLGWRLTRDKDDAAALRDEVNTRVRSLAEQTPDLVGCWLSHRHELARVAAGDEIRPPGYGLAAEDHDELLRRLKSLFRSPPPGTPRLPLLFAEGGGRSRVEFALSLCATSIRDLCPLDAPPVELLLQENIRPMCDWLLGEVDEGRFDFAARYPVPTVAGEGDAAGACSPAEALWWTFASNNEAIGLALRLDGGGAAPDAGFRRFETWVTRTLLPEAGRELLLIAANGATASADRGSPPTPTPLVDREKQVFDVIREHGPIQIAALIERSGWKKSAVNAAVKTLKDRGLVANRRGQGGGYFVTSASDNGADQ